MVWWHCQQISAWLGRNVVPNLLTLGASVFPWMLWQFVHATSFNECLPEVQNARLRLPLWQVRQTPACVAAGTPFLNGLLGLAFIGSFRCSVASPWHAWHMLPLASLFAPCGERSIAFHWASWQFAQMGFTGPLV